MTNDVSQEDTLCPDTASGITWESATPTLSSHDSCTSLQGVVPLVACRRQRIQPVAY